MSVPSGLDRFQRAMVSKRPDTCGFCGVATQPGTDYAALNNGKWIGVCAIHATSVTEQCKALLLAIQTDAVAFGLDDAALAAVNQHAPANVAEVLAGNVTANEAVAAAVKLSDALAAVRSFKPVDPIVGKLTAALSGTTLTAWERDFCTSLLSQLAQGRTLSDKQVARADSIIAPAPVTANACDPEDGGVYVVNGTYYLVHLSKAGRLYAMILASEPVAGSKLDWQYNPGGIQAVRRSGRAITAAEAAALGHATSYCCFCSRELRDEGEGRSVEVGYGPVCGPRHGLPWG